MKKNRVAEDVIKELRELYDGNELKHWMNVGAYCGGKTEKAIQIRHYIAAKLQKKIFAGQRNPPLRVCTENYIATLLRREFDEEFDKLLTLEQEKRIKEILDKYKCPKNCPGPFCSMTYPANCGWLPSESINN